MAIPIINTSIYNSVWNEPAPSEMVITTTTSAVGGTNLIAGTAYTSGDFTLTTTGGYTSTGVIGTVANYQYGFQTVDKSVINGKDGEIFMDLKNMKFKVYCDEKGWVEYDMEDFSTKNKKVELNGYRETSISEVIKERSKRTVLVEKVSKKKIITISSGPYSFTIGNLGIWTGDNTVVGGYNNIAIGSSSTAGYVNTTTGASALYSTGTATAGNYGTLTIGGGSSAINSALTI